MRLILENLSKRPEMSMRELAEQYTARYPSPRPWNDLYIIRRACKQLCRSGHIILIKEGKPKKLIARKIPEQSLPWEGTTAKLDKHFYSKNTKAKKEREEEARGFQR